MPEVQHYGDYGFDTQMDYFQDAGRYGKQLDAVRFTLGKPISKDDSGNAPKHRKLRKWWKAAFLFWKRDTSTACSLITSFPSVIHCCCCPHRKDRWESLYTTQSGYDSRRSSSETLWAEGVPYLSLIYDGQLRAFASASPAMPIYLIT